jgi:aminopeptidase N
MRTLPVLASSLLVLLGACTMSDPAPVMDVSSGISLDLARSRSACVAGISYDLHFRLPADGDRILGDVTIGFDLESADVDLPLDFDGDDLSVSAVNDVPAEVRIVANHVILPRSALRSGRNTVQARFSSRIAPAGTPLTVYRDATDGAAYFYTLLVPADAHRLFPCFDQPDMKASFRLTLDIPGDWQAVANEGVVDAQPIEGGLRRWTFDGTPPLPTYLFAFAAGPFTIIEAPALPPNVAGVTQPLRLFLRASKLEDVDAETLLSLHARALAHQEAVFGHPYPFKKLDCVLCPGFPYGGMEHAGAIFYRESGLVFDHAPTELERLSRSLLIDHEVSHQWFGNLVTMTWFDDLWLKEGFATYMAFRTLEEVEPEHRPWLRFHQRVKPAALRTDVTEGTTPIWQELQNLADAKSAYGPIVYNKAPAILRQLERRLGEDAFFQGVQAFLARHRFGNATWQDLMDALGDAAGEDLGPWCERWILDRGAPRLRVELDMDAAGRVTSAHLLQEDPLAQGRTWPLRTSLLVTDAEGNRTSTDVACDGQRTPLPTLAGRPCPRWILPNGDDATFVQVVLDPHSLRGLSASLPDELDPFVRALGFSAIWETVREARGDPLEFAELALLLLANERDAQSAASVMAALATTLGRYLSDEDAAPLRRRATALLRGLLHDPSAAPLRLDIFRRLTRTSRDPDELAFLERVLDGVEPVPDLDLGREDRFLLVAALIAHDRPEAGARLDALVSGGDDVARYAYAARAANPHTKAAVFESYLDPDHPPEQWVQGSLGAFHWPGQHALTLPFLSRALDAAAWVKEHRRIFFMPAWLEAFIGAHGTQEALDIVDRWLDAHPDLAPDIRRKLLVPRHELEAAVRIRGLSRNPPTPTGGS